MAVRRDGPTPAGGVRSEAFMLDARGRPTDDPALAVEAEIVEYDAEGYEVARTYGRTDQPAAQTTAEWPDDEPVEGGVWDTTVSIDGQVKPVEHVEEWRILHDWLDDAGWRTMLTKLITMPKWPSAPESLKREVYAYLEQTRP